MNVYRFRKIENLLDKFQELEKQSIYFASPEELNDPMEGFRDIFWQGDKIVWTNFFRNYIPWLSETYLWLKCTDGSIKLEPDHIYPRKIWLDQLLNNICDTVFEKYELDKCIVEIVKTNRTARYDEVLFYLMAIHPTALLEIEKRCIELEILPKNEQSLVKLPDSLERLQGGKLLELIQKTEGESSRPSLFDMMDAILGDIHLSYEYRYRSKSQNTFGENQQPVIFDFPRVYLKLLITHLLYPKWYAACFMRDYKNSSVWGHYGDSHKGACLIFETEVTDKGNNLTLNAITGYDGDGERWGPVPRPFYEINYQDRAGEVDFFRSIGVLPLSDLMDSWYSDQNGNISECAAHIEPDGDEDSWRKGYWDNFYRDITVKTKDWEYEQEIRLILTSLISNLDDKRQRTLTYDFNSLKGIVFGINTPDSDKLEIIEIIERKCRKNNRTDFKFYQAYYSHENSDIRKREIRPLSRIFENINSAAP